MSDPLVICLGLLLLAASAMYSGSETASYCLSRLRLDADARAGRWTARLISRLVRDDAGLLVTILIGNNLAIELLTHLTEHRLGHLAWVPTGARELVVALVVTPVVFFFAELLPKDVFHRRPNSLLALTAPALLVSRLVFLPLALPLRALSLLLGRLLSVDEDALSAALGREAVVELLEHSTRQGSLTPHAERLARNALDLKSETLLSVLVPWEKVQHLDVEASDGALREAVAEATSTRLPVLEPDGSVLTYVHQLEVLGANTEPVLERRRPLLALSADLSVDRALNRLRIGGHRLALVLPEGDPASVGGEPLGIVSLKDLVEKISGDLADW